MAVALFAVTAFMTCQMANADPVGDSSRWALVLNDLYNTMPHLNNKFGTIQNVCVCGYQSYNICKNGHVYSHSFCRDQNGQSCGENDSDTGVTCP
jgi:hypothetical protein